MKVKPQTLDVADIGQQERSDGNREMESIRLIQKSPVLAIALTFVAWAFQSSANATGVQGGCEPLARTDLSGAIQAYVSGHGAFCLTEDLKQRSVWDFGTGSERGSPRRNGVIAVFSGSGFRVDLRGHLVTGTPFDNTNGIVVQEDARDVRITNGIVRTPGPMGLAIAMAPLKAPGDDSDSPEDEPPLRLVDVVNGQEQNRAWNYLPVTNYVADHLAIRSGGHGVMMGGTRNIVRDSTIEVDSATAILSYGPNALIENNTIIVHKTKGDPANGAPLGTSAALKLRDADGTIIRNNRIIIKGGLFGDKADVAINLLASHDVVIENNVVEGANSLVRKDAVSTTIERGNTLR